MSNYDYKYKQDGGKYGKWLLLGIHAIILTLVILMLK